MLWKVVVLVKGQVAIEAAGRRAFPGFELHRVARTPSTQDLARRAARAGAAEGWCCVAAEQTAGRGRQQRRWVAPAGSSLLVSVLLRPPAGVAAGVPLAVGLAVADAVSACCPGVQVGLKWPNDVLSTGGGKLAGVLVEMEQGAAVAGVGVNLRVEEFPPGVAGVSLHHLVGRGEASPGWEEVLAALLSALGGRMRELRDGGVAATVAAWRPRAVGLGGAVRVETPGGVVSGVARDVADDGALLVEVEGGGGEVQRVLAGDVHLLRR